ncbi:MAG: DUF1080 domain-containing protein [Planctomycetia bacterium]|nr:DUF1080 domain-containing protein [Planctomycetia bacterium]
MQRSPCGAGGRGWVQRPDHAKTKALAKPGEWNRYVITCAGSSLQVEFNGERVIDLDLATSAMKDRPLRGLIGFQDEGKPVSYRNVRIVELPAEPGLP